MNTITLHNTLPAVFAGRGDTGSEIWLRDVTFERGKHYLISAESGTGKSSLCSYLYGYRTDYSGTMAFDGRDIRQLSVAEWCQVRVHNLAYLAQDMKLFPELTALENIMPLLSRDFFTSSLVKIALTPFWQSSKLPFMPTTIVLSPIWVTICLS